ncbi:MAG: hypothetical protein WBG02_12025 [Candidatus Acidiferrum sp.]
MAAIAQGAATIILTSYALVIKARAEALLNDITSLRVGASTELDVQQLARRYKRYISDHHDTQRTNTITFEIRNKWLSAMRLEPATRFKSWITVRDGSVSQIGAGLFRTMDIYPTFQASAGMVEENAMHTKDSWGSSSHYYFPTPVGKPYLLVKLDPQATPAQRQRAFDFSFRCLIKPGWGCDLPCDYLPSAWQDWKESLHGSDLYPDIFNQHYPKTRDVNQNDFQCGNTMRADLPQTPQP